MTDKSKAFFVFVPVFFAFAAIVLFYDPPVLVTAILAAGVGAVHGWIDGHYGTNVLGTFWSGLWDKMKVLYQKIHKNV